MKEERRQIQKQSHVGELSACDSHKQADLPQLVHCEA